MEHPEINRMLGVLEEDPTEICHEKEVKLEQSWTITCSGNADTKIGADSFTGEQLAFNKTSSTSIHSIPGNPGITIIIPTAPKPPQKDPDPLLVENIKLEEEIEDLNMIEEFDSQLESNFDPDNEVIESKEHTFNLENASDWFHGQLSAEQAEERLRLSGMDKCFLTRESDIRDEEYNNFDYEKYIISCLAKGSIRHFIIPNVFDRNDIISESTAQVISTINYCQHPVLPLNGNCEKDSEGKKKFAKGICFVCNQTYHDPSHTKNSNHLIRHLKTHKLSQCGDCQQFISKGSFNFHRLTQCTQGKSPKTFKCQLCDYTTPLKYVLQKHLKNHEKKKKKETQGYSKKTEDKNGRTVYRYSYSYFCPEEGCDWKGKDKNRLEQHINRIHTPQPVKEPKVFECEKCEYKTNIKRCLIRHRKVHEGPTKDQPLPCEMCGKMLTSKHMLTRHLVLEHGMMSNSKIPENCTKCVQCKFIVEDEKLESHVCIKKHKCKECGEMFYNLHEKSKHFAVKHSELLPSSNCEICGTIFRGNGASSRLESHLKVHTEDREVECPQCGKKVKGLENHIATMHTQNDGMKHKCSYCGKGFVNMHSLQRHIDSIHLDARKYPCRYGCSVRYNDFSNRNAHEKKIHGALHSRSDGNN